MKTSLRNFLLSDTGITDLISTRCYSFPAPQKAVMPYILMTRITEEPGRTLSKPNERYREIWQIDCYALEDDEAEELKIAVRTKLDVCAPFVMGSFNIFNSFMESSNDFSELELKGGQQGVYRKQMDFIIIRKKTKNA
jgi:hypothetical protein